MCNCFRLIPHPYALIPSASLCHRHVIRAAELAASLNPLSPGSPSRDSMTYAIPFLLSLPNAPGIRLKRASHESGSQIPCDELDVAPVALLSFLDELPVRSIIVEVTRHL